MKKATGWCIFWILVQTVFPFCAVGADYSIDDLFRIALERSEKIKITEQNRSLAEAGKNKKRSILMPRLSAYGSYTDFTESKKMADIPLFPGVVYPGTVIQPDYMGQWGVRLDQAMTLNGKEITDFNISRDNILKQEKDIYAMKEDYMMSVATAYYEVLRARKTLEIADATVKRLTLYREAAEKRLKIGEVTKTVLLRADGELSGALSDQIRAKNALDLSSALLARIVGIEEGFQLKEKLDKDVPLPPIDDYFALALSERAEIKSAEIDKKMAENQIRVAKGGYWPIVSLQGVYGRFDQYPVSTMTVRESVYASLALNFPFFEGGLRVAEVKEATVRDKQTFLKWEDLKKSIRIEVESAYVELKNQRGIIKSLEDQLAFARDNYQSVSRQFEFGLANSIDVMDANTLLVSAERQLATAVYSHQVYQIRIKRATGLLLKEITQAQGQLASKATTENP
ncbi:MAG: TolC family protein [Syntrophus sp. SKADARSKE-3]|nr:TolC family protein [Syntrophus sp. SKADARSKE-3]